MSSIEGTQRLRKSERRRESEVSRLKIKFGYFVLMFAVLLLVLSRPCIADERI